MVDCAQAYDNHGCNGGLPSHAFEYIKDNGITTEDMYPYKAEDGDCYYKKVWAEGFSLNGAYNITRGDEDSMKNILANVGPVSVAFQVVDGFRDYKSGVYKSEICKNGPKDVNHAVLAVGYGTDDSGNDYYIVKNSWSADWGNNGFFMIERGTNMCGMA